MKQVKEIKFKTGLTKLRNINCPVILVSPEDVPDWEGYVGNKKFLVTLSPVGQDKPDYEAMQQDAEHWRKVKKIFDEGGGIPTLLGTMRDIIVGERVAADKEDEPDDGLDPKPEGKDD